jgi:hypothetical protein
MDASILLDNRRFDGFINEIKKAVGATLAVARHAKVCV